MQQGVRQKLDDDNCDNQKRQFADDEAPRYETAEDVASNFHELKRSGHRGVFVLKVIGDIYTNDAVTETFTSAEA